MAIYIAPYMNPMKAYLFVGLKMKKEEAFGIGFTFVFT